MSIRYLPRVGALSAVLAVPGLAFAQAAPAVTETVTDIATYVAPVAAIGLAVLGVVLAVKGVKWFRRAL